MSAPFNPYAFPSHGTMGEVVERGMSLRDYFAAKAMQALVLGDGIHGLLQELSVQHWGEEAPTGSSEPHVDSSPRDLPTLAGFAYEYADAMLKARES